MIQVKIQGDLVIEKGARFNVIAITVALLVIFSFPGELLAQELYRWVNDKGIIHFSDSLHSIPEKYRREAEKRLFATSMEMPTPVPQSESERSNEPAPLEPDDVQGLGSPNANCTGA